MNIQLETIGIVVQDMATTLTFYRRLGLPIPEGLDHEANVDFQAPNGITLGFLTAALAAQADPGYRASAGGGGQSLNLQFRCATPAGVDETFQRLTAAGAPAYARPRDAPWGQRFARVTDPDGRVVNLYAPL